jgi:hypothetical protein
MDSIYVSKELIVDCSPLKCYLTEKQIEIYNRTLESRNYPACWRILKKINLHLNPVQASNRKSKHILRNLEQK